MRRIFLLLTLISASGCLIIAAPSPNSLTDAESAEGWRLLFDGKTTDQWRGYARSYFPTNGWVVEGDCLKNQSSGGKYGGGGGDLVTREKFGDFDLKFEWRISPGGNSGVKYFVLEGKTGKNGVGCEYQILDDLKNPDALHGSTRMAGALYDLIPPNAGKKLKPVGEFNESEIIVRGQHVEHWLNGVRIVSYEIDSPEMKQAIAASKFKKVAGFGEKKPTVLLLQDHGDAVWFRNIKIRSF